jgi:hypothetical protein
MSPAADHASAIASDTAAGPISDPPQAPQKWIRSPNFRSLRRSLAARGRNRLSRECRRAKSAE